MEERMNLQRARETYETVCRAMENAEWKYEKDDDSLEVSLGMNGDAFPMRCVYRIDKERKVFGLYIPLPFDIPEDRRIHLCLAANLINWQLADGSFECSPIKDGILFRVTQCYDGCTVSIDQVQYMILIACHTVDEYGVRLKDLAEGNLELDGFVESLAQ